MAESSQVNEHYRIYKPSIITKLDSCLSVSFMLIIGKYKAGGQRVPLAWSGSHVTISGNNISMPMTMAIHPMNGITPM